MNGIALFEPLIREMTLLTRETKNNYDASKKQNLGKDVLAAKNEALKSRLHELASTFKERLFLLQLASCEPDEELLFCCAQYLSVHDPESAKELVKEAPHVAPVLDIELANAENGLISILQKEDYEEAIKKLEEQRTSFSNRREDELVRLLKLVQLKKLLQQEKYNQAISYAKTHLADADSELEMAFTGVAESRLVETLKPPKPNKVRQCFRENHKFSGGNNLAAIISLGLSCVKSDLCGTELSSNPNCPGCLPIFKDYGRWIPCADKDTSSLDEDLLVLPSGVCINREKLKKYTKSKGQNPTWCFVDPGNPGDPVERVPWTAAKRVYTP